MQKIAEKQPQDQEWLEEQVEEDKTQFGEWMLRVENLTLKIFAFQFEATLVANVEYDERNCD